MIRMTAMTAQIQRRQANKAQQAKALQNAVVADAVVVVAAVAIVQAAPAAQDQAVPAQLLRAERHSSGLFRSCPKTASPRGPV